VFAREVAQVAWVAGAGDVQLYYLDDHEQFLLVAHGEEQLLDRTTIAHEAFLRAAFDLRPAAITVSGTGRVVSASARDEEAVLVEFLRGRPGAPSTRRGGAGRRIRRRRHHGP
jgi:leucyl aminopeptidase (aminopeptidase T)